jgi:hypothetical protein
MGETVTLGLPNIFFHSARAVAERTQRPFESVLVEWLDRTAEMLPIEQLPDDQVLALRDLQLGEEEQAELSELLARGREGELTSEDRVRLEALMRMYERGLLYKARALKVAVDRGLQPRLDAD